MSNRDKNDAIEEKVVIEAYKALRRLADEDEDENDDEDEDEDENDENGDEDENETLGAVVDELRKASDAETLARLCWVIKTLAEYDHDNSIMDGLAFAQAGVQVVEATRKAVGWRHVDAMQQSCATMRVLYDSDRGNMDMEIVDAGAPAVLVEVLVLLGKSNSSPRKAVEALLSMAPGNVDELMEAGVPVALVDSGASAANAARPVICAKVFMLLTRDDTRDALVRADAHEVIWRERPDRWKQCLPVLAGPDPEWTDTEPEPQERVMYRIRLARAMTLVPDWVAKHADKFSSNHRNLTISFRARTFLFAFGDELQPIGGWNPDWSLLMRQQIIETAERAVVQALQMNAAVINERIL